MESYKTESQYRSDIIEICKRVHANGWVASNDGNISIKIAPNAVLCTPTGMSKGYLTPDQLVKVDMEGNKIEGELEASSEVKIHLDVYKNKKGINSAVHAHPPYSTAYAVAGIPLDQCVIPEIIVSLGSIPLTEYGTPSTHEIPESIRKHLQDHNAFLYAEPWGICHRGGCIPGILQDGKYGAFCQDQPSGKDPGKCQ